MKFNFNSIHYFFSLALEQAQKAYECDEVPVGCIIVDEVGKVITKAYNLKEKNQNALHHCEILAINQASEINKGWRLLGHSIFVTLEPCTMCFAALIQCRIENLYFAAYDTKAGALSTKIFKAQNNSLNHNFNVIGGIHQYEGGEILSQYFRQKRKFY